MVFSVTCSLSFCLLFFTSGRSWSQRPVLFVPLISDIFARVLPTILLCKGVSYKTPAGNHFPWASQLQTPPPAAHLHQPTSQNLPIGGAREESLFLDMAWVYPIISGAFCVLSPSPKVLSPFPQHPSLGLLTLESLIPTFNLTHLKFLWVFCVPDLSCLIKTGSPQSRDILFF